jgi:hypothetical protein
MHVPLQLAPQAPQFVLLVWVLTSQPSAGLLLQSAKPVLQVNPHAPLVQVAVALAGAGHALLHAPQWLGVERVSTSQPSAGLLLQSPKPVLQAEPQAPPVQVAVALARTGQALPQRPQWFVSVAGRTSQPLPAWRSQSAEPAAQRYPQVPAAQTGAALVRAGQVTPHMPQFDGSMLVGTHALLHRVCWAGQLGTQAPLVHTCPLGQAALHAPQWARSVWVSRQVPPQLVSPAPHEVTHMPAEHTCPAPHAMPQAPQ